jgi:rhomboid family GlyGly-CTERM serine protease
MRPRLIRPPAHSILCPLLLTLLVLLAQALPPGSQQSLEYRYLALEQGELWRLVSGHLVHLGWPHLQLNLLGLWLIWGLFLKQETAATCARLLLLCCIGVSVLMYLFSPEVAWYRGLSGVLHGLLVWALLRQWSSHPPSHALLLGMLLLKLLWEQLSGPLPGSEDLVSGRVIVESHLYGAVSGALLWAPSLFTREVSA